MRVFSAYTTRSSVMFYQVLRILLSFVTIFYCVNGENVPQKNDKRGDIDLQMCVESFDVHKNKIIRTEDSQEMGAKYINEIDLDSRKECLRLCCETEQCDVFVFEEKRPGSCYLFHCGPPDDFKCKFTNHANYTSAVLTVNLNSRNTVELEEQIRRTQQDHDLQSLRKLADNSPAEYSVLEPTASVVTEVSKIVILTTAASIKPVCSRNQFECRTSGDCIAIYNACDGIPQCADGSDEAADLGCPTKKPSMPPPVAIQQQTLSAPVNSANYQPSIQRHKPYDAAYGHQEKDSRPWQLSGHQLAPQQERIQYPHQVVISQPQVNLGSQRYQWEYQPLYEQNNGNFNSINSFRGPSNSNPYEPEQSHIFNHKGPGVIGEGGDGGAYIDQNRQYAPYYPPENGNWQEGQPQQPPSILPTPQNSPSLIPKLQPQVTDKPPLCKDDEKQGKTPPITNVVQSSKSMGQKNSIIPKAKTEIDDSVTSENDKTHHNTVKTAKPHKHTETKIFVEQSNEEIKGHLIMDRLQDSNEDRDLRPKGAVISLALGLTTTALMAALIACRLRMVRRRGRRGHGPYAHDADYLVNGMYL